MYAYVRFVEDGKRLILPVTSIKKFDPTKTIDSFQRYKIKWTDGMYYEGTIFFTEESYEAVKARVDRKRAIVPNIQLPLKPCPETTDEGNYRDSDTKLHKSKADDAAKKHANMKKRLEKLVPSNRKESDKDQGKENTPVIKLEPNPSISTPARIAKEVTINSAMTAEITKLDTYNQEINAETTNDIFRYVSDTKITHRRAEALESPQPSTETNHDMTPKNQSPNTLELTLRTTLSESLESIPPLTNSCLDKKQLVDLPTNETKEKKRSESPDKLTIGVNKNDLTNKIPSGDINYNFHSRFARLKSNQTIFMNDLIINDVPVSEKTNQLKTKIGLSESPKATKQVTDSHTVNQTGAIDQIMNPRKRKSADGPNSKKTECLPQTEIREAKIVVPKRIGNLVTRTASTTQKTTLKPSSATTLKPSSALAEDLKKQNDHQVEIKKLKLKVENLERLLRDKNLMIHQLTGLNMDLQKTVIGGFESLQAAVTDVCALQAAANVNGIDTTKTGLLPIGYQRKTDKMVHLGRDIWITGPVYDTIICVSKSPSQFAKNMAVAVYGMETLKKSSVTGATCNRKKKEGAVAKPRLDPNKLLAIRDIFGHWLNTTKQLDEVSIELTVKELGTFISRKITELNRKRKQHTMTMEDFIDDQLNNNGHELDVDAAPGTELEMDDCYFPPASP